MDEESFATQSPLSDIAISLLLVLDGIQLNDSLQRSPVDSELEHVGP
jgi:hypothetical protein